MKLKLFGSSGARGLVNVALTPTSAAQIGMAVATHAKARKVLVARDTRVSGVMLENALVSGLMASGANVDCVGIIPTPVLAVLTKELGADVGLMVTASHNPPQYNGIKIFDNNGMAYDEKRQDEVEKIVESRSQLFAEWQKVGEASSVQEDCMYVEMAEKGIDLRKKWHVVVDPGCGATFKLAPMVLDHLGCRVTAVNAQPDGYFPARISEPNADSLRQLTKVVAGLGADVGFAFDGDGDRVAIIDEKGTFLDFDVALSAYAGHTVEEARGGLVVTNVEASMCVEKVVEARGGRVLRTKVGDVYVSEAIKSHKAVFGGEPCGAWIHPTFHYCPDGILSSALFLQALEDRRIAVSEFTADVPKYVTRRKNVPCRNEVKYSVVSSLVDGLKTAFPERKDFSRVDGLRLAFDNGWILIRASGTEPLIRLTVEGESLKTAKRIIETGLGVVRKTVQRMQR